MKNKLIKLLLIPLILTPLFCYSCAKKTDEKKEAEKMNYDTKLKLLKDLIFIDRNVEYDDENDKTRVRDWIGDLIINQKPSKQKQHKEIIKYMLQNKMNLIINNITEKKYQTETIDNEIKKLKETVDTITLIIKEHEKLLKQKRNRKERLDSEEENDWVLEQWLKRQKK